MNVKKIALTAFLFINFCSVYCQNKFEITDAKELYVDTNIPLYDGKERIPFKELIIKDFRFDTSKLGYFKNTKICLQKSNAEGLSYFLNNHFKNTFDPSSDNSLLIVIKKLWIQKDAFDIVSTDKIRTFFTGIDHLKTGACIADIEVYSKKQNQFYPLIKIRDNFFYYPYNQSKLSDFILLPFDSLIKKAATIDITKVVANKKPYTWEEISLNYSSRFEMPVLMATSTAKGVFKTFDDFKRNETSYPDFIVKKTKLVDDLYVIKNNKEELLTDVWGYYNGKDYYLKSGFNFYKLFRQNNSWDIYGNKYITEKYNQFSYDGIILTTVSPTEVKRPLQLDMETGNLY